MYLQKDTEYEPTNEDATFKPDNEITRAEMVVILNRLVGDRLVEGFEYSDFVDIKNSWAKEEI